MLVFSLSKPLFIRPGYSVISWPSNGKYKSISLYKKENGMSIQTDQHLYKPDSYTQKSCRTMPFLHDCGSF